MAQQGYWMICEELYPGNKSQGKPAVYMGLVEGFLNIHVMASTRLEVLEQAKDKLRQNIRFLQKVYQNLPEPSRSDTPYPDCGLPNAVHYFISLAEVSVSEKVGEQRVA